MRLRYVVLLSVSLLSVLISATYFYVKAELEYLKIYVPSVDNLTSQPNEVYTAIYGKDNLLMYKKYYVKSELLPQSYDIEQLSVLVDMLVNSKRENSTPRGVERWKLHIMRTQGIEPFSLKGVVLDYYAEKLLADIKLNGFASEVVRWYTLEALNTSYSKHKLHEMYLNTAKYADNVYGISAAANHFYSKDISKCNYLELAYLVAILSGNNNILDPITDFANIDSIARTYIHNLYKVGIIDANEYEFIKDLKVALKPEIYQTIEPTYVKTVLDSIKGDNRLDETKDIIVINTNYDKDATIKVRRAMHKYLADKNNSLQLAFVMINTKSKSVDVVIGSRDEMSRVNRAINMKRQMASTFKPFVYLTAFNNGYKPNDRIVDRPYTFWASGFSYKPDNYGGIFYGNTSLGMGLVHSLNNATIKLAENVGLRKVRDTAMKAGMATNMLPIHAMALGSYATTPLNVAEMYSTIANSGIKQKPSFIHSIKVNDKFLDMLEPSSRVASTRATKQVVSLMQDVAKIGTARSAGLIEGTAIKTGTSNNYIDAWAAAIFDDYVAVVWLGYDNFASMGEGGVGGSMAAPFIAMVQDEFYDNNTTFTIVER